MKCLHLSLLLAALAVFASACADDSRASEREPASARAAAASEPPPGHWYVARDPAPGAPASEASEALRGLGYAAGYDDATEFSGVMLAEAERMQPGLNLYSSGHAPEAFLMESNGTIVHRWTVDLESLWPDQELEFGYVRKARLLSGDRLFAVFANKGLVALDRDSNVLWSYGQPTHHDVCEMDDGTIVTLDRNPRVIPEFHESRTLIDDRLVLLESDGTVICQVSLLECLLRSEFADQARELVHTEIQRGLDAEALVLEQRAAEFAADPELAKRLDAVGDFFHSNSVRVIGPEFAARNDGFEEGWFLISIRNVDALVVIELDEDRRSGVARHLLSGGWRKQHEAVPLPSGRILLFDNRGSIRPNGQHRARVIEIDPHSGEVLSSLDQADGRPFLSPVAGSCQPLENGNTLVTESTGGTAYEMTPEGECVWKFVSPHRAGEDGKFVALLCDMIRIDRSAVEWLEADER